MANTAKKILIIEDDKFLMKLYSDKLRREGFDVAMSITGEEGLLRAPSYEPDLIFLDIILPRENGFDVLSKLKLDPATKHIPVIILTNLGREKDVKTGIELGAADYLIKTDFSITKLGEVARKHLVNKQRRKT